MFLNNNLKSLTNICRLSAKFGRKRDKWSCFSSVADDFSTLTDNKNSNDTVDLSYSVYEDQQCSESGSVPIVVAHGLFGSKNNWHSLAKALNRRTSRKIVTVDLRCHGESPHHSYVDCDVMSSDLIRLVTKELQLSKVALMGHSMGGVVVLKTALKMPQLTEFVVSVDVSIESSVPSDTMVSYMNKMLSIDWDPTLSLSSVRKIVDNELKDTINDPYVRQWLLMNLVKDEEGKVRWRLDLQSLRNNCEHLFRRFKTDGIYSGPSLYVLGGASIYVTPQMHDSIRTQFPNSQFDYIMDGGHWVHSQKPNEFLDVVTKFINGLN